MKTMKMVGWLLALFLIFLLGVFAEEYIRSLARKPIRVSIEESVHAKVSAHVQPDFMWIGKAWWIKIESEVPVAINLDGKWSAIIPPGTNTIFSNHDVNNTTKFGTNIWYKTPAEIIVKRPEPQPSSPGYK